MKFWKVEAIGNDFPLIHLDDFAGDLAQLSIATCDRRFGIGGDGLLGVRMEDGDLRLRMFNPDGSEDFCGNGLRCAARHAHSLGWVGRQFAMRHLDRRVATSIRDETVVTEMGLASYRPSDIPVRFAEDPENTFDRVVWTQDEREFRGSSLTTGSTHTIIVGALPDDATFQAVSQRMEEDSQFPDRTSVIWSETLGERRLRIRIWERAVGETLGCGTGSAAAAIDHLRRQGSGGRVEVRNPGGSLWVSADAWDAPFSVEGEAIEVYDGMWLGKQ